jgi:hypothetical protein
LDNGKPLRISDLPVSAQAGISDTLGRNATQYRFRPTRDGFDVLNSAQGLNAHFTSKGMEIDLRQLRWKMIPCGYGYGEKLNTLETVQPESNDNRLSYRRKQLTETYVNGPAGLEQIFTISQKPDRTRGLPLTIKIALGSDLTARVEPDGTTLNLQNRVGKTLLRYAGLEASDVDGRGMRAWIEIQHAEMLLRVDDAGAKYPVTIDPLIQLAELTASDGATSDELGYSVAVSGSTVAVGAPLDSVNGFFGVGAVYVFVKPATGWGNVTQIAKLTASDGQYATELGGSVAIANDTIVAGAINVGMSESGPAYVFVKPPGGWTDMTQSAELSASDGYAYDVFGNTLAISGDTIVVGSSGAGAYIYVRPESGWSNTTQTAKLTSGAADDFGFGVAIDGNTIVVGNPSGNQTLGSAYVFTKPPGGWTNTAAFDAELTGSDIAQYAAFGFAVAINGETIVVGAPDAHATGGSTGPGAAYIFVEPTSGWKTTTETAELTAGGKANPRTVRLVGGR